MLKSYIHQLLKFSRLKVFLSMVLFFFLGLSQGLSLMLIVPLLKTIGLTGVHDPGTVSGPTGFIIRIFSLLGLSLNLSTVLGAYVIIVSFLAILKRFQALLTVEIQEGFIYYLRHRIYTALTYAEWSFILQRKTADLTHAITSDVQRVGLGTHFFLRSLSEVLLILFHILVAFLFSVPLTAATLVFGGMMMFFMRPLNQKAEESGYFLRDSRKSMYSAIIEHFLGMKTSKSCGVETEHIRKMQQITTAIQNQRFRFAKIQMTTRMVYEIAAVVALALYFAAALNIDALKVPVTHLLVLVYIFSRLMPRFSSLMQNVQNIKNMLPAFQGISQLYQEAQEAREFSPQTTNDPLVIKENVSFHEVSFRYSASSSREALQDVSFTIPVRQITALTGASGAGKSTAADLLLGLLKPSKGKITVDGREIGEKDLLTWRHSIGYVPQETFFFHDTLRANLLWAMPSASENQLWESLRMASAHDFVQHLPNGLDTIIGDRGIMLSGGERQRVALARALLRQPQLLVLDEATSALDSENEIRIQQAIESLQGKLTIVIIAHRQSTLSCADQVIVLDKGRVRR
jgi:ATP-binding cassette, subfamily C, bacterial